MADKKKKKVTTTISLFKNQNRGSSAKIYEGRLLGLIDDKQFTILVNEKEIQRKFLTTEATPLREIVDNYRKMNGLRLVMAVKKVNGEDADKHLFVSEKLELLANSGKTDSNAYSDVEAGFTGEESYWLWVEEREE